MSEEETKAAFALEVALCANPHPRAETCRVCKAQVFVGCGTTEVDVRRACEFCPGAMTSGCPWRGAVHAGGA